ncbi:MAG: endonuclease/exonuclease/phosphatase family protein [Candidatus Fimenecus sp.]
MKKTVKIISLSLCAALVLGIGGTAVGAYIRGSTEKYALPDGFSDAMQQVSSETKSGEVRIMSANLLVHYKSWGGTDARPRAKMFFETLNTYKPDVVGLQEISGQWYDCILRYKGNYELLYPLSTGALVRMTGLMYNSDTLNLLEKGQIEYTDGTNSRLRRAVWGVFESKETHEQFAVISTHFDLIRTGQEAEMREIMQSEAAEIIALSENLKATYSVPVFCVGDFNTMNPGEGVDPVMDAPEIYETLCKSLTDTKDIAAESVSGNGCTPDAPTYDHIFLNGSATVRRYAIISPDVLSQMSDHYPIFVDTDIAQK